MRRLRPRGRPPKESAPVGPKVIPTPETDESLTFAWYERASRDLQVKLVAAVSEVKICECDCVSSLFHK